MPSILESSALAEEISIISEAMGFGVSADQKLFAQWNIFDKKISFGKDEDCTLLIGDNWPYLMNLASTNKGSVDLCYIDPPYNTGSKFLYKDTWKAKKKGMFGCHSAWMKFMLPRLVAAREILAESGVIAISIDDYEYAYLKILLDQIFGECNFIGSVVVCRSKNGKGSKKNIASNHEYLAIYGKSHSARLRGAPDSIDNYNKRDKYGSYRVDGLFRKKGEASLRIERPNMFYPLYYDLAGNVFVEPSSGLSEVFPLDSKGVERRWLWARDTARERSWQLYASKKGVIYVKNYSEINKRTKLKTLWDNAAFYTDRATIEVKNIFGKKVFDTPKPLSFISNILDTMAEPDSLIMDFFAGSGTTAHAAFALNSIDNGTRQTILMENDEEIPITHIAYEQGFRKISDITSARLACIQKTNPSYSYKVLDKNFR